MNRIWGLLGSDATGKRDPINRQTWEEELCLTRSAPLAGMLGRKVDVVFHCACPGTASANSEEPTYRLTYEQ